MKAREIESKLKDKFGKNSVAEVGFALYRLQVLQRYRRFRGRNLLRRYGQFVRVKVLEATFELDLHSWYQMDLFVGFDGGRLYEPGTMCLMRRLLKEGDTFMDIGASIGYFTVLGGIKVGPRGLVLAFEPSPTSFERLLRNCQINNLRNVRASQCAIGGRDGHSYLYLSKEESSSTMLGPTAEARTPVIVPVTRLEKAMQVESVDLVKIDVEGYEMQVLPSLKQLAFSNPNMMLICEYNSSVYERTQSSPHVLFDRLHDIWPHIYEILEDQLPRPVRGPLTDAMQISRRTCNLLCVPDSQLQFLEEVVSTSPSSESSVS